MTSTYLENLGFIINNKKSVSFPRNRVSRNDSELSVYGSQVARREDQEDQAGSTPLTTYCSTISSITFSTFGETEYDHSSSTNGPTILLLSVNLPNLSTNHQDYWILVQLSPQALEDLQ